MAKKYRVAPRKCACLQKIIDALEARKNSDEVDELVIEHIDWALIQQNERLIQQSNSISRKTQRVIRSVEKGLPRDA
uniref:Uncharacterized protein n=1 Tax=Shewanella eurypsychrophilus TaxID=2593656 RepID=A0A7S9J1X0_9GAMM